MQQSSAFTKTNRMSGVGVVILFFRQVALLGRSLGFVVLYAAYKYINSEAYASFGLSYILISIGLLLLTAIVIAFLKYRNFKFYIDRERSVFIVEKGIFSKEKMIVQLNKIFQINLKQNVWQQTLDVYSLEIETAGSTHAEISIPALSENIAQELKADLERSLDTNDQKVTEEVLEQNDPMRERIFIGNKNTAYAALFSHYGSGLRVAAGFVLVLWFQFMEYSNTFSQKDDRELLISIWDSMDLDLLLLLGGIFLFTPFLINTSRFIIRYYNIAYRPGKDRELLIDFGLFTLQQNIFKTPKLQELNIAYNWFLKRRQLIFVSLLQSDNAEGRKQKNVITFPGMPQTQLKQIEQLLYGSPIKKGTRIRPYINKLWFGIAVRSLAWAVLAYVFVIGFEMPLEGLYLFAGAIVWSILMAVLRFKNDALYLHPEFIIKQSGSLRKNLSIIEPHKIQNIELAQKVWRPKFGNIRLHTAAGGLNATWYDHDTLYLWSEYLMQSIIRSKKDWM